MAPNLAQTPRALLGPIGFVGITVREVAALDASTSGFEGPSIGAAARDASSASAAVATSRETAVVAARNLDGTGAQA